MEGQASCDSSSVVEVELTKTAPKSSVDPQRKILTRPAAGRKLGIKTVVVAVVVGEEVELMMVSSGVEDDSDSDC